MYEVEIISISSESADVISKQLDKIVDDDTSSFCGYVTLHHHNFSFTTPEIHLNFDKDEKLRQTNLPANKSVNNFIIKIEGDDISAVTELANEIHETLRGKPEYIDTSILLNITNNVITLMIGAECDYYPVISLP